MISNNVIFDTVTFRAWDTAGKQGVDDILYDFTQLNNGNLVFVGNKGGGNGSYPLWVIVTDSTGKNQYYEKQFTISVVDTDTITNTFPFSVIATPDSGFTIVGKGTFGTSSGWDAFTVHFVPKDSTAVMTRDKTSASSGYAIKTHISRSRLTIESDAIGNNKSTVSLFDLTGRSVAVKTGSNNKIVMDISHMSLGTYLLKVKSNNSIRTQKIFIKN